MDPRIQIAILGAIACFFAFELVTRLRISRWVWREIARYFILMELGAMRLVRLVVKPKYVLTGACNKRGDCCKMIVGDPPRFIKKTWLLQVFATYHRVMHNFTPVGRGPNEEIIFSCGHLKTDGRCGIYRHRPMLCRNYPILPFFNPPKVIPGCGYVITPRVVAEMKPRASLPILNPRVISHHPTRSGERDRLDHEEDYHLVSLEPPASGLTKPNPTIAPE